MTGERERDDPPVAPAPQRHPREWPFATVLATVLAGIVVVAADRFRAGALLIGAAVLLAAGLRAVLPERRAGLLVVRSRFGDVITLGVMGAALVTLSLAVPANP